VRDQAERPTAPVVPGNPELARSARRDTAPGLDAARAAIAAEHRGKQQGRHSSRSNRS
jgi:hypothetical protein